MLLEQAQIMTSANGAVLEIIEGNTAVYKSATGELTSLLGFQLHLHGTFTEKCANSQAPQACSHIRTAPQSSVSRQVFSNLNIGSMMLLPILDSERKLKAVLKLTSEADDYFREDNVGEFYEWLFPLLKSISAAMKDAERQGSIASTKAKTVNKEILSKLSDAFPVLDADCGLIMFNSLASLIKEGVFITNTDGQCVYTNERYQELRDMTFEETMSKDSCITRLHPEDSHTVLLLWEEAVKHQANLNSSFRCFNSDGETLFLAVAAEPIIIDGIFMGHVGIISTTNPW